MGKNNEKRGPGDEKDGYEELHYFTNVIQLTSKKELVSSKTVPQENRGRARTFGLPVAFQLPSQLLYADHV